VFAGAAVAVAAGTDFVVEGTVYLGKLLVRRARVQVGGRMLTLSCSVPKIEAR
jgi:hypothetical protein